MDKNRNSTPPHYDTHNWMEMEKTKQIAKKKEKKKIISAFPRKVEV